MVTPRSATYRRPLQPGVHASGFFVTRRITAGGSGAGASHWLMAVRAGRDLASAGYVGYPGEAIATRVASDAPMRAHLESAPAPASRLERYWGPFFLGENGFADRRSTTPGARFKGRRPGSDPASDNDGTSSGRSQLNRRGDETHAAKTFGPFGCRLQKKSAERLKPGILTKKQHPSIFFQLSIPFQSKYLPPRIPPPVRLIHSRNPSNFPELRPPPLTLPYSLLQFPIRYHYLQWPFVGAILGGVLTRFSTCTAEDAPAGSTGRAAQKSTSTQPGRTFAYST